jgi:YDG domain/MBG domain (YGX type)/S-layer homology domain
MQTQSISFRTFTWNKVWTIILIAAMFLAATPILSASADTTDYYSPTRATGNGRGWTNPFYALASDNLYATAIKTNKFLKLTNFFIPSIPGNSTIDGIEVTVEGLTAGKQVEVAIVGNSGGFTSPKLTTFTSTESTLTLGGAADTWGKSWTAIDFQNKFTVKLTVTGTGGAVSIDHVRVKVYFTPPNTSLVLNPVSGPYNGTANMTATLTVRATGVPLDNRTVSFTLNGASVGTATTNASGVATLSNVSLTGIAAGYYPYGAGAEFAGDGSWNATSIAADLRVNGTATTLVANPISGTYRGTSSPISATLTQTVGGAALSGKTINFYLDDVLIGSAATNASGIASIAGVDLTGYDAGSYIGSFEATFAGDGIIEPADDFGDLTVNPVALTVTGGLVPDNKTYDGTTAATLTVGSPTLNGVLSGDDATLNTTGATAAFLDKNVGTGKTVQISGLTLDGTTAGNYTITQPTRQANITKAMLTVTADNQTKAAGSADPTFTFSYSVLLGSDTGAEIDTPPTCNVPAPHAGAGTYSIICSGGVDNNYDFSYVNGTLTVNAVGNAPTDISLSNSSINENLAAGTVVGTFSTTDPDAGDTFTYSFCGGADDASFTITGNSLKSAAVFNWLVKRNYSICVRSTDSTALSTTKTFVISINKTTASFIDVPTSHWAWMYIERLYAAGITGGCGTSPLRYCPDGNVTRAEMAVFLLRGIHGSSYAPPAVGASTGFGDVSTSYWAAAWIKQLAVEGITAGCGSGNYCPGNPVTRAEMAVFLLRAKHGSSYAPPAVGASTGFGDVSTSYWAAAWIKQLVVEGITAGCGSGNYCPGNPVTRAEMAVFLVRTFNLP